MKRGTPEHPKTTELELALDLEKWGAVGVLEAMWHFAGKFTPAGDLGKYSNAAIARGIGWRGDADKLIKALVDTHWLDVSHCRLIVHDWSEHADDATHMKLCRAKQYFADGRRPQFKGISGKERDTLESHFVATPYLRNDYAVPQPYLLPSPPLPSLPLPSPPLDQQPCPNSQKAANVGRDGDLKDDDSIVDKQGTLRTGLHKTSEGNGATPGTPCVEVSGILGGVNGRNGASDSDASTKAKTVNEAVVVEVKAVTPAQKIYEHYPKKVGKARAIVEIQKAIALESKEQGIDRDAAFQYIDERTMAFAISPKGQGQYRLDPERFYKYGRYNDDPAEWQRSSEDQSTARRNTPVVHGYVSGTIREDIAEALAADAKRQAEAALATGPDPGDDALFEPPY